MTAPERSRFLRWTLVQGSQNRLCSSPDRIVSAYLDLAENRAERGIVTKMADWIQFLNQFLELSNYPILEDKGKVSAMEAKLRAEGEYETYRKRQDIEYVSDFDREIKRLEGEQS